MKFILAYPELTGMDGDLLDAGPIGETAAAAEQAGFAAFALTEHPMPGANWLQHGGHQTLDPFVGLAFAAAATERLRLLTYLAVVPYRNPFLLAKSASTLDRLSGGRFILGVGTGYHKTEFHSLGVDFEERNALFDEALDVLPQAWSGEPFSALGRHFDARDVVQLPRPTQDPIPIWIGGNSKLTRRRVAARAQGWMPMGGSPELARSTRTPNLQSLDDLREKIAALMTEAGPRATGIDICFQYEDPTILQPTVDVERHRAALRELEEAGVTWLSVGAHRPTPAEHLDFIQAFGETYCGG